LLIRCKRKAREQSKARQASLIDNASTTTSVEQGSGLRLGRPGYIDNTSATVSAGHQNNLRVGTSD